MENNRTNQPIQLIALDLDGTLLTTDKRLTARTRDALVGAIDRGIEIVLITGRPYFGLPEQLLEIPGVRYAVTSNGAITYDLQSGNKVRTTCIAPEIAWQIAQFPQVTNHVYSFFVDGIGYCDEEAFARMWERYRGTKFEDYVRKSRKGVSDLEAFLADAPEGIENIWVSTPDAACRDAVNRMIRDRWDVRTVFTAQTDVEIGSTEADKGIALLELARKLGIHRECVMAMGDNDNDRGMLEAAGISVAMGNAPASIRQAADVVADTNDRDGVAKIIEGLLAKDWI